MDFGTTGSVIGGGAIIGLIVGAWNQIKQYFNYLTNMVFETVSFQEDELNDAMRLYLHKHFRYSPFSAKIYFGIMDYVRPMKKIL